MLRKSFVIGASLIAMGLGYALAGQAEARTLADVLTIDDELDVGDARLQRRRDGIMFDVHTTGLESGAAYTVWWIVFNNPDECGDACGGDDLGTPAVEGSVLHATGRVADPLGNGRFTAFLPKGLVRLNRTETGRERHRLGPGLQNVTGAEIHLVIRFHGPAAGGAALVEQLATFNGGCDNPEDGGDVDGDDCVDVQVVVFPLQGR